MVEGWREGGRKPLPAQRGRGDEARGYEPRPTRGLYEWGPSVPKTIEGGGKQGIVSYYKHELETWAEGIGPYIP